MTINEVSEKSGLSKDTLRYYEKIGLISAVTRTDSGIRNYDEQTYNRINFICCMRKAGLSIKFLKEYIDLVDLGDNTISERKMILHNQHSILLEKLKDINETIHYLEHKLEIYDENLANKKV